MTPRALKRRGDWKKKFFSSHTQIDPLVTFYGWVEFFVNLFLPSNNLFRLFFPLPVLSIHVGCTGPFYSEADSGLTIPRMCVYYTRCESRHALGKTSRNEEGREKKKGKNRVKKRKRENAEGCPFFRFTGNIKSWGERKRRGLGKARGT